MSTANSTLAKLLVGEKNRNPRYSYQGLNNRWNRWSENQSINRWQSMPINRLILIIDEQSMHGFFVIIDFSDYQFLSIINANRSDNWHRLSSIVIDWFSFLMRFIFSQDLQKESESKLWPIVLLWPVITVFRTEAVHVVLLAFFRAALSFSIWSLFFQLLLYGSPI